MKLEYINDSLSLKIKCVSDVGDLLQETFGKKKMAFGISDQDIFELANDVISESGFMEDLIRFAKNDPAANESLTYVYNSYRGIKAMMYYRVANYIYNWSILDSVDRIVVISLVRDLSEKGKVETGIDIHPLAQIGKGCVIDHGIGTKIMGCDFESRVESRTIIVGETTIIGENCTILNDVVIGASTVNEGYSEKKRHPTIGDNVTICAGVKIFGGINIGDNVFIAPECRIEHDIPANTKVLIINQIQIMNNKDEEPVWLDGIVYDGTELLLYGENISEVEITLVDEQYIERTDLIINVIERNNHYISFTIKKIEKLNISQLAKDSHIKVTLSDKYYYLSSRVIRRYIDKLR